MRRAVVRRVSLRLIPFMALMYFVNYLDRTNIGFAKLTMSADLGLTESMFGLASGLFFIGYLLFEVPSNLALHRFGARIWMARILVTWGIIASAMAFVPNPGWLYGLRVLLGIAEAGFFPGMIRLAELLPADRILDRDPDIMESPTIRRRGRPTAHRPSSCGRAARPRCSRSSARASRRARRWSPAVAGRAWSAGRTPSTGACSWLWTR